MKALLDTNILIDYLNGIEDARCEMARYDINLISPITWMEIMVGVTPDHEKTVRRFLSGFRQVAIDTAIAELAVGIRRQFKIRLPDAIIWASAKQQNALLVSRNHKDFPATEPGIRIPYKL